MEEERNKIYTIVAIVAVVAVLLSCVAGALAGGVAGFLTGRRQAQIVTSQGMHWQWEVLPDMPSMPFPDPDEPLPVPEILPSDVVGAVVMDVVPGTPAEEAGLQPGDVITAIDRTAINRRNPLPGVIARYEPGDRITLTFWRGGAERTVQVTLAEHPETRGQAYLGVYFEMQVRPSIEMPGG